MFSRSDMEKKRKTEEMAMFRKLTFKGKVEHIFTYYKFVFIGVVVGGVVLFGVLDMFVFNPPTPVFAHVNIFGRYLTPIQLRDIYDYMQDYLGEMVETYEIRVENVFAAEEGPDALFSAAQMQRFSAQLMVQEIDLIVSAEHFFEQLVELRVFMDLRQVFTDDELAAFGRRVVRSPEGVPLVIMLPTNSNLTQLATRQNNAPERLFAGIVVNTRRLDAASTVMLNLIED